ncbi:heavy metal translocating P-type ATPase [Bacillus suaedae]|uniref:Cadmium-translocating P-type ATPase n=1 Tax=Halalkalibacter suaedae TaxID=2822140 RepID=A0A940WX68_9BACI|nr:heavy metal translocating P-type ATPase [Bacillus suaedae]MBP3953348.1 cadmium-translocating P-type ATPase [Bacillus suaedae]
MTWLLFINKKNVFFKPEWVSAHSWKIELIAALMSGLLIGIGWIVQDGFQAVSAGIFIAAYIIGGYAKAKEGITETISEKKLNVELLMILSAIGSAVIGYWFEGAILIFIFALSGALESYTTKKSHREISALMNLQPEEAIRIDGDNEERVPIKKLNLGDLLLIKPGERIPADGIIIEGQSIIDESAITGESISVSKKVNDEVFAGTVNLRGFLKMKMTKANEETLFQRIIQLVQTAKSEKSPSQQQIEQFEGTYVKIVLLLVGLMMILPHFVFGWSWTETFYRAMVLLVVASPCALVASISPAILSTISNGARNGILFKGGIHLERLSKIKAIAFDKTGTLTKGKPNVTDILVRDDLTIETVLTNVAAIERYSTHPLATTIVEYASDHVDSQRKLAIENMEDVSGFGVQAKVDGAIWKVGKAEFVGVKEALEFHKYEVDRLSNEGKTIVFVKDKKGIAGVIALKDVVRDEAVVAIQALQEAGIQTIMLTGDRTQTATAIAKECGISEFIAECLPDTKVKEVKKLEQKYGKVAMVGDGINDAPALATASVGIAMGGGTDVALETSDIVLMKNHLSRIADAILLTKRMNRIIKQNIIFSILVICLLIVSNFMQSLSLPLGVIGHEGSTILVILNGLRLLRK